MADFTPFPKVPRWSRDIIITEKIDGMNASVCISPHDPSNPSPDLIAVKDDQDGRLWGLRAGSRTRWIRAGKLTDNYGFAAWCFEHKYDLFSLGEGHHFGEWWGKGIRRGYGLNERRFSLFNVSRWGEEHPHCCHVVPVLYTGPNLELAVASKLDYLVQRGSQAVRGFMDPEGIMIFHTAAGMVFKKTIKNDETPKSLLQ